jgi:hypothetical protein
MPQQRYDALYCFGDLGRQARGVRTAQLASGGDRFALFGEDTAECKSDAGGGGLFVEQCAVPALGGGKIARAFGKPRKPEPGFGASGGVAILENCHEKRPRALPILGCGTLVREPDQVCRFEAGAAPAFAKGRGRRTNGCD